MRYYVGIDGGGSKTRFLSIDEDGRMVAEHLSGGTYYRQLGADAVIATLKCGIQAVTGGVADKVAAISFGMPGYGETPDEDESFVALLGECFSPVPVYVANDVAMAFHGAFAGGPGILLVAGTGSMAWGRDLLNREYRCGGWSHLFGDEGSGFWIGRCALELFSKESDGRLPKTALYTLLREHLKIPLTADDVSIIQKAESLFANRAEMASLHRVLQKAAEQGDEIARAVYTEASNELASIIQAIYSKMFFAGKNVPVSYVGGLFNCRELILEPVKAKTLAAFSADFHPPLLTPCQGAVLYAAGQLCDTEAYLHLRDGMLYEEGTYV